MRRLGTVFFEDLLAEIDVDDFHANPVEQLFQADLVRGALVADRQQQDIGMEVDHRLRLQRAVGEVAEERQALHLGIRGNIGVVAIEIGCPQVVAPGDDLAEGIVGLDRGQSIDHAPLAKDGPFHRLVERDLASGDVGHRKTVSGRASDRRNEAARQGRRKNNFLHGFPLKLLRKPFMLCTRSRQIVSFRIIPSLLASLHSFQV